MLVLTRRIGEQILIAGKIQITVTAIADGQVRLGLSAPADVLIDREDVHVRRREWSAP